MADHTKEIEELKKQLAALGTQDGAIEELYGRALADSEKRYREAVAKNEATALEKKKQASTKRYLDVYNYDRFAENRGLSASGESAQARLDLATAEANAINAADSEAARANGDSRREHESEIFELGQEKLNSSIEEKKSQRDELTRKIDALAASADTKIADDGEKDDSYTPKLTANALASELFTRFSSDGKTLSASESEDIREYIDNLTSQTKLSEDYVNDLMFSLRAKGYSQNENTDMTQDERDAVIKQAKDKGKKIYDFVYERTLKKSNAVLARLEARREQVTASLQTLYVNSTTHRLFRTLALEMGFTKKQIDSFYAYAAKQGGKLRLKETAKADDGAEN